jgi:hypothetical protein
MPKPPRPTPKAKNAPLPRRLFFEPDTPAEEIAAGMNGADRRERGRSQGAPGGQARQAPEAG